METFNGHKLSRLFRLFMCFTSREKLSLKSAPVHEQFQRVRPPKATLNKMIALNEIPFKEVTWHETAGILNFLPHTHSMEWPSESRGKPAAVRGELILKTLEKEF